MKVVFADTWFYLAILDVSDHDHPRAMEWLKAFDGRIVTTRWVFVEVANGLCAPHFRARVSAFLARMERGEKVKIIGESDSLYHEGRAFFDSRSDKEWSLTDCISFVVMEREGLREALTHDHHFRQAGFVPMFA